MNRLIHLFYLMMFLCHSVYAQDITIHGTIINGNTPLCGVQIYIQETQQGTLSDSSGKFTLTNINPKEYTLQLSLIGFETKMIKVNTINGSVDLAIIHMNELASQLNEVVVSGTLKEVSKAKSPIPIEVYTPAYFRKNPTPALFESLQIINGVRPQINCSVCNTGDIHINGMEGPYTLILIDGMPIVSGLGSVYGLNGIPNAMIERIEIVKGPASTLYGSEAVGGLINVITKSAIKVPVLSVETFATDWGEFNLDIGLKTKFKKAYSLFGINYFNYQNPIDRNGDNFTDLTNQHRISLFNKIDFVRKGGKQAQIAARYVYEDRFGGEMNWDKDFRGGDSIYGESIFTSRFELLGNYEFNLWKEKIVFQFSYSDHQQNSAYGNTLYLANQKTGFSQFKWNHTFKNNELVGGLALRYNYYDDNTVATESADSLLTNRPEVSFLPGIFFQNEWNINKKNNLLVGMRYDYHFVHQHILSPRVNYQYHPNLKHNFRLGLGNGFRVVNLFTEEHAAITGSRKLIISETLNPERSWNSTLNYVKSFFNTNYFASLDFTLFYTYFSNKILPDYESNPDAIIYSNLQGYAVSKGLSITGEFNYKNRLKLIAGATLMDVYRIELNTKHTQLLTERISGTFTLSYYLPKVLMGIDYTGSVYGPMDLPVLPNDPRSDRSPWYSIQNIQISKKLPSNNWEFFAGVKNLLNFKPPANSILRANDPFDKNTGDINQNPYGHTFDTSYVYSSFQGIRYFFGIRYNSKK